LIRSNRAPTEAEGVRSLTPLFHGGGFGGSGLMAWDPDRHREV
jgi:hypothetical protein